MADKYFVGDVGTDVIVNCGVDISGSSNRKLLVKKPSGTEVEWTPANVYQSNYLRYTIGSADFNEAGTYQLQSFLTLSSWTGRGELAEFRIYDHYRD